MQQFVLRCSILSDEGNLGVSIGGRQRLAIVLLILCDFVDFATEDCVLPTIKSGNQRALCDPRVT